MQKMGGVLAAGCMALVLLGAILMPTPDASQAQVQPMPGNPDFKGPMKDYFPLQSGYSWTYRTTEAGGQTVTTTVQAMGTEPQADGTYLERVETQRGPFRFRAWYNRLNKGVVLLQGVGVAGDAQINRYQPAKVFMKNPLLPGESWQWRGTIVGLRLLSMQETGKIGREETVVVPAGTFRAIKVVVTSTASQPNLTMTSTRWFAESVGLVKEVVRSANQSSTMELVDYSFKSRSE